MYLGYAYDKITELYDYYGTIISRSTCNKLGGTHPYHYNSVDHIQYLHLLGYLRQDRYRMPNNTRGQCPRVFV